MRPDFKEPAKRIVQLFIKGNDITIYLEAEIERELNRLYEEMNFRQKELMTLIKELAEFEESPYFSQKAKTLVSRFGLS